MVRYNSSMALPIQVMAYSGYKPNERPCTFLIEEDLYDIHEVIQRWREPFFEFFKVRTTNGKKFVLRCERDTEEWALCSEYDCAELMCRPSIELIVVDAVTVRRAEGLMESCQHCYPNEADTPFDWLIAEVTGKHGKYDFVMAEVARCPICKQPVSEGTLVERKD
jgi:hypothetical protein